MKIINTLLIFAIATYACLLSSLTGYTQEKIRLTDAEIASIGVIANQIDINYANLAKEKSKTEEVLKFAATMASDHKAVIDQAVALVTKLGVTPKDNEVGQKLLNDSQTVLKKLKSKQGKAFDKAYIDNEVEYHKSVIGAVEGLLIPQADNRELKGFLQNIIPALKAHLAHAEMVQKQMK